MVVSKEGAGRVGGNGLADSFLRINTKKKHPKTTHAIYKDEKSRVHTDLSADPWRGALNSISQAGSERGAAQRRGRPAPSGKRRCEPARSAPSGGGAEERNLFPSRRETPINPKSKVKSGGTEGFKHPDANNPFYELRAPLALSGVWALQGRN